MVKLKVKVNNDKKGGVGHSEDDSTLNTTPGPRAYTPELAYAALNSVANFHYPR